MKASSDHIVFLNGEFHQKEEALIPAAIQGLYYGAGCFETLRGEKGSFFRLNLHLQRLKEAMMWLGFPDDYVPSPESWTDWVTELIEQNEMTDENVVIRIQVSLSGSRGYTISELTPLILITCTPVVEKTVPLTLTLSDIRVVPNASQPSRLKLSNALHYMKAMQEAKHKGFDDALMLTTDGSISETSIANIFWIKDHTLYTPGTHCDILPGIIRNTVLEIAQKKGISPEIGKYNADVIQQVDTVFVTNSILELQPVSNLDDHKFKTDHPMLQMFKSELRKLKSGEN